MYKYTDYLPSYLRGTVKEIEALGESIDLEAETAQENMTRVYHNQFIARCDEETLRRRELLFNISSDPVNDSIDFRKQRLMIRYRMRVPLTMNYLFRRLDEIIGKDKYKAWVSYGDWQLNLGGWRLGDKPFREEPYILHIEAATENIGWNHEIHVLVNKIKPANLVFSFSPMVSQAVEINETIAVYPVSWNYKLGFWRLSDSPFRNDERMEVVKVPDASSIKQEFLDEHARLSINMITAVRLNESIVISDIHKTTEDGTAVIRYTVYADMGLSEVTSIQLLREGGAALTSCGVYIPIPEGDQIAIRHILPHKEGSANA